MRQSKEEVLKLLNSQSLKKTSCSSLFTPELEEEICIAIMSSDKGIGLLCKEYPDWPNKSTIFRWIKQNEEFRKQYELAKKIQFFELVDEVYDLPNQVWFHKDELGRVRVDPDSIDFIQFCSDELKRQIVRFTPRKYKYDHEEENHSGDLLHLV